MSFSNTPGGWDRPRRSGPPPAGSGGAECGGAATLRPPTVAEVVDVGRLLRVFHGRRAWAGPAPGRDGLTWSDYGSAEVAGVFREVRRAALAGRYVPHGERRRMVPRPGRAPRPLDIGGVVDRCVAASLAGLMDEYREGVMTDRAFAYRRGRGPADMLARLAVLARRHSLWVVGNHDVAAAFPSAPLDRVLEAHRRHGVTGPELLAFIGSVIRGATDRATGLSQGSPYSPCAMELFLHDALDARSGGDSVNAPRLRYSDNVACLSRSVPEAELQRQRCGALLADVGLSLKEPADPVERTIADLANGEETQLLGLTLGRRAGTMTFSIARPAWDKLAERLLECHGRHNPPEAARLAALGWIASMAPASEERLDCEHTDRVVGGAREAGFGELPRNSVERAWNASREQWRNTLRSAEA